MRKYMRWIRVIALAASFVLFAAGCTAAETNSATVAPATAEISENAASETVFISSSVGGEGEAFIDVAGELIALEDGSGFNMAIDIGTPMSIVLRPAADWTVGTVTFDGNPVTFEIDANGDFRFPLPSANGGDLYVQFKEGASAPVTTDSAAPVTSNNETQAPDASQKSSASADTASSTQQSSAQNSSDSAQEDNGNITVDFSGGGLLYANTDGTLSNIGDGETLSVPVGDTVHFEIMPFEGWAVRTIQMDGQAVYFDIADDETISFSVSAGRNSDLMVMLMEAASAPVD